MKGRFAFFAGGGLCLACTLWPTSGITKQACRQAPVDYAQVDIILRNNECTDCHNATPHPASGLHLTTLAGLMKGGIRRSPVVAGDAGKSLLTRSIRREGGVPRMPPGNREMMKVSEIVTIEHWINEGAKPSPYSDALERYYEAIQSKDWSAAVEACREMQKVRIDQVPTEGAAAKLSLQPLLELGDEDAWYKAAGKAVKYRPANARFLNDLAQTIVSPDSKLKRKDAKLALEAAKLAADASNRRASAILDTLACAYFLAGDKDKAISTEQEALQCIDAQGGLRQGIEANLKRFGG